MRPLRHHDRFKKKVNDEPKEKTIDATVTAYASLPELTDDSPFVTASGAKTSQGVVANNCLPFGVEIGMYSGGLSNGVEVWQVYEVNDRMNARYGCERFDIWMPTKAEARAWGIRQQTIKIIKK